jgi:hypothetical protein
MIGATNNMSLNYTTFFKDELKNIKKIKELNNKLTIYLAGSSNELKYREEVIYKYKDIFNLINPMNVFVKDSELSYLIVNRDINLIEESDILVAYIETPSFGTSMEIRTANIEIKKIYVINPNGLYENDLWLKSHYNKYFRTIDDCFNYIIKEQI